MRSWRRIVRMFGALALASPLAFAGVQFIKVTDTGTGDANATLSVPEASALTSLILSVSNTGTISSDAYWSVKLDSVDGTAWDAELHRQTDANGIGGLWSPEQPLFVKKGDAITVTYPNDGNLSGGTWSVQGYFSVK